MQADTNLSSFGPKTDPCCSLLNCLQSVGPNYPNAVDVHCEMFLSKFSYFYRQPWSFGGQNAVLLPLNFRAC